MLLEIGGMKSVVNTGRGPWRCQVLVNAAYYRLLYSKSDWNRIQRGSLIAGGEKFAADYLPLRFQNYARAYLGYTAKKKKGSPLQLTGRLRKYVLENYRISATATGSRARMIIEVPTPEMTNVAGGERVGVARTYAANPVVQRVLSAVTEREAAVVEQVAQETMIALIEASESRTIKRGIAAGQTRMSLTDLQRAKLPSNARAHLKSQHPQRSLAA